ncbi:hypothetical protein C5Y96_25010 [Blastopirellula marina]|uniref:Uncharacterized protein n=2 Tax=Pirellulales TaxID=2691354 RepID=A0A2S8EZ24_9BACT|nr:hypothetical protein C5Y96_25010 [Blastopirellula marina]RCS41602.1 hypothetical protein DTL36_25060 [Bremerella cremea]
MDGPMDRPLPSTSCVGIALSLTIMLIVGCGSDSTVAKHTDEKSPASAPNRFHAPDDVRPMAQLAAHLEISEAHENIVNNPYANPKRLPPVAKSKPSDKPTSLESIRFPLKIEKSVQPEQSPQTEPPAKPAPSMPRKPEELLLEPPTHIHGPKPNIAQSQPAPTKPAPSKPAPSKPAPTPPAPAKPVPPQPAPAKSIAAQPDQMRSVLESKPLTAPSQQLEPLAINPPQIEAPRSVPAPPAARPTPPAEMPLASSRPELQLLPEVDDMDLEPPAMRHIPQAPAMPNMLGSSQPTAEPKLPAPKPESASQTPSKFVSLAPPAPQQEITLNPAKQNIVDVADMPLGSHTAAPRSVVMNPNFAPTMQQRAQVDHAMLAVRGRMASLVDHGLILAQRGAYYSARAEFIQALRLATQTLDTAEKTHRHSEALADAIAALDEAGEFIPAGAQLEGNVDLNLVVDAHRTPVLKGKDLQYETALTAAQAYFSFAQQRLNVACGGMPETARALVGLGRIQQYLNNTTGDNRTLVGPRSIALFQTALAVDGLNYEAANELGVLLARYGQLEDAKAALLQGVKASPRPEIWQNLASVHQTLGEVEMARRASLEAEAAQQFANMNAGLDAVRWVSPEQMAQHGRGDAGLKQSQEEAAVPPVAQRQRSTSRSTW